MGYTIFGCSFGFFLLYRSIKLKEKLLSCLGLTIFFAGLLVLGPCCDFLTILLTGNNLDNSYGLVGILSGVWAAPAILFGIYIGAELLTPKRKWVILSICLGFSILFELFILLDTANSFTFTYPENPGEDIIDSHLVLRSPAGIIAFGFLISLLIFNGFGFLYKGIQSTGVIRKKFLFLSLGYILYVVFFMLEAYALGIFLFLIRIALMGCFWLWYLGIKEETVKTEKLLSIKETIELRESKLSLVKTLTYHRPPIIPDEEVSLYREQEICLVCKGKVEESNDFICSECNTLYCKNCTQALSNLENACWVCNAPFDESKPSEPFKEQPEVKIDVEVTKKTKK